MLSPNGGGLLRRRIPVCLTAVAEEDETLLNTSSSSLLLPLLLLLLLLEGARGASLLGGAGCCSEEAEPATASETREVRDGRASLFGRLMPRASPGMPALPWPTTSAADEGRVAVAFAPPFKFNRLREAPALAANVADAAAADADPE